MPALSQKCWRKVLIYRCRHCRLPFPRFGQLLSHVNRHSNGGSHECVECLKIFNSFFIYQLHWRFFHGKEKPVVGQMCDPRFIFHSELRKCFKSQKWRGRNLADRQTVVIEAQNMKETRKQFAAVPESIKRSCHIASKHRSADSVAVGYAPKSISRLANGNVRLNKASTYSCPQCSQVFLVLSQLKQHMRTHNDFRPFKCVQCDKQFKQKSHLVQHVRTVHDGERPHECVECGKAFSRRSHLADHLVIHTRGKVFQCDLCELRFALCSQLTAHQKV